MPTKLKQRIALTESQQCVKREMIIRRGIIYAPEIRAIANVCMMDATDVAELINSRNEAGIIINEEVDKAVMHVPIGSTNRQLAYAQTLLEDKLDRLRTADLPLTSHDPLEILDFARKVVAPTQVNVNVQQNTINEPQIFNFEGMSYEQINALIEKVQGAITSGEIIDAIEFRDVEPATTGCASGAVTASRKNVLTAAKD